MDLDTCSGAFLFHKPRAEALRIIAGYDSTATDEVPQLVEEHLDRLDGWTRCGEMWVSLHRGKLAEEPQDEKMDPQPARRLRAKVKPRTRLE